MIDEDNQFYLDLFINIVIDNDNYIYLSYFFFMESFPSPALATLPDIKTLKELRFTAMYEQILKELLAVDSLGIS